MGRFAIIVISLLVYTCFVNAQEQTLSIVFVYADSQISAEKQRHIIEETHAAFDYWRNRGHSIPYTTITVTHMRVDNIYAWNYYAIHEHSMYVTERDMGAFAVSQLMVIPEDLPHSYAAIIAHELGHTLYNYPDTYGVGLADTICSQDIMCNPIAAYFQTLTVYLPLTLDTR